MSFIAMLTAFYVDNGPSLPFWKSLPPIDFWILPGIVGIPLTVVGLYKNRLTRPHGRKSAGNSPVIDGQKDRIVKKG